MTIEQRNVVDIVAVNEKTSRVILGVSDHLPWADDNEHLLMLQDKLNDYLSYIESGEMYESFPKAAGKEIEIRVVHKFAPNSEGEKFLHLVGNFIRESGYYFSSGYLSDFEKNSGIPES
jgi:hypothetical protein